MCFIMGLRGAALVLRAALGQDGINAPLHHGRLRDKLLKGLNTFMD